MKMLLYGPLAFLITAWHASPSWFAHPERCLLRQIQKPYSAAKTRTAFVKVRLPHSPLTTVQNLVFLPTFISSLTSQRNEHFVWHDHPTAYKAMFSLAGSPKSWIFTVCLTEQMWSHDKIQSTYTVRGSTNTNATHLTTFLASNIAAILPTTKAWAL